MKMKSEMTASNDQLVAFTEDPDLRGEEEVKTGRAWRADELRLKSHDDLHKLWYVLLKEKNKLKSDQLMSVQLAQQYIKYSDLKKVRLSMARLLTVVNERKKIRSLYRAHLEDQYI